MHMYSLIQVPSTTCVCSALGLTDIKHRVPSQALVTMSAKEMSAQEACMQLLLPSGGDKAIEIPADGACCTMGSSPDSPWVGSSSMQTQGDGWGSRLDLGFRTNRIVLGPGASLSITSLQLERVHMFPVFSTLEPDAPDAQRRPLTPTFVRCAHAR